MYFINEGECKYSKNCYIENNYPSALEEHMNNKDIARRIVSLFDKSRFRDYTEQEKKDYDIDIWDEAKDNLLKNLVILLSFDFNKISDIFQKIYPSKLPQNTPIYTPTIIRLHWALLHSRRELGLPTDEAYYIENKGIPYIPIVKGEDEFEERKKILERIGKDANIEIERNIRNIENRENRENKKEEEGVDDKMDKFFDTLLGEKISKDTQRLFEIELKEKKEIKEDFPLKIERKKDEKDWEKLIG